MRNFTFKRLSLIKPLCFVALFLLDSRTGGSQSYTTHYVASGSWQYFSKASKIEIAPNFCTTVSIALKKSDSAFISNNTSTKGSLETCGFFGLSNALPVYLFYTIVDVAGLMASSNYPTLFDLRNVTSGNVGFEGINAVIKKKCINEKFYEFFLLQNFIKDSYRVTRIIGQNSIITLQTILLLVSSITV